MTPYKIDIIRTQDALLKLEHEWLALEPSMVQLPFVKFDWIVSWWEHLRAKRSALMDELCTFVFRDTTGALRGVAPMMITKRLNVAGFSLRQLQFMGADTNITELRMIAAPAAELDDMYQALIGYLQQGHVNYDWLKLTGLEIPSPALERATTTFGNPTWQHDIPNFFLPLKPTWAEFKTALPRNIKESLRKCYNAPKRDGYEFALNVIEDPAQVQSAVNELLRLHGMRAQLTDTVTHANVFASTDSQAFLHEFCRRSAARGEFRAFQLKHQDRIIATRIGFISGDSIYLYYSGYDPEFSKYSVMTTTVAEAIQHSIENGLKTVNLSTGRDVSKERWNPQELSYREQEIVGQHSSNRIAYWLFKYARHLWKQGSTGKILGKLFARNTNTYP